MRVREAGWRDLAAMAELEARCFPADAWTDATFWSELAQRPRRTYWVAVDETDGSRLVGYAGLDLAGEVADVMTIAVDPARRGAGLGGQLVEVLHEEGARAGAGAMMLEVRADNEPARQLYSRRGYAVVHTRPGYYRLGPGGAAAVDALVMRKELVRP
ncbi:ribosomal protein S18-alanine N-acetyltransferase [Ornithinimicrobium sp. LYQ103]|uniref:ribosomal protein S18-alanine N-acetyltransferase n=1 Tax=Ornithinimicrobium sp. LYQ103 TaxID=3378796 RepID=UPI0038518F83